MLKLLLVLSLFCSLYINASALPEYPLLPESVSNNAVAKVNTQHGSYLLSFMGLGEPKDYKSIHNKLWALKLNDDHWQEKSPVPSSINPKGRLASIAVGIGEYAYLFGGYTVDKNHTEISSPDVYRYDIENDQYIKLKPMPVPVDDSVALVYQQRFIYLISGWHNDGNVNLVQVYDIETDVWRQASPFLGLPVFGHSGGIASNTMLVCDGVTVVAHKVMDEKRRSFEGVAQCLKGTIDITDPLKIDWRIVKHPTGKGRYRMAATSIGNDIVFLGGSTNPYNYNGIGYNGTPSEASNQYWIFNIPSNSWKKLTSKIKTMDHRGLIQVDDQLLTIGGMNNNQQVINKVITHRFNR